VLRPAEREALPNSPGGEREQLFVGLDARYDAEQPRLVGEAADAVR